jgi:hypothetical protein
MIGKTEKLKPSISSRTARLISHGIRTVGSTYAFSFIEESLQVNEAYSVEKFCSWIDKNIHRASTKMPFVESNYQNLYKNFFLKEI